MSLIEYSLTYYQKCMMREGHDSLCGGYTLLKRCNDAYVIF